MKKFFDNNIHPSARILDDLLEEPNIREASDEVEFVRLAQKYRHHDCEQCDEKLCLICEGIGWIVNGQGDVADAEDNKRRDYALDNGMVF